MTSPLLAAAVGARAVTASVYPGPLAALFLILLLLATSVWIGGWFSLIVISRTTTATLSAPDRVAFFRRFGKVYGIQSSIALVVALLFGLLLLLGMPWTALSTWCVVLSAVLVLALIAGILQARSQRVLRQRLLRSPGEEGEALRAKIAAGGRSAILLRTSLGVFSVAILVLGVLRMV